MYRSLVVFLALTAFARIACSNDFAIQSSSNGVPEISTPLEHRLFGFNVPWYNFQRGHMAGGEASARIIELMKPFKGAFYRYPGGDESNLFDWSASQGTHSFRREVQTANAGFQFPVFGIEEFLTFVSAVGGVPLYTLNLCGDGGECSSELGARQARDLVARFGRGVSGETDVSCRLGVACRIGYWELGNELDIGRWKWSAEKYASFAGEVSRAVHSVEAEAVTIAAISTAPWSARSRAESPRSFNAEVGSQLGGEVGGFAFHAYYDGMTVPAILDQTDISVQQLKVASHAASTDAIYITEHARWPRRPILGDWQATWGTTRDLSGALSVADYLLALAPHPEVKAAMLHALGTRGPWQLVESPDEGRTLVPTALYWGLRVLREGLQGHLLSVARVDEDASAYRGGYAVRAVVTKPELSKVAVVIVNRGASSKSIRVGSSYGINSDVPADRFQVFGPDPSARNSAESPREIEMQHSTALAEVSGGDVLLDVPPFSITTYVFTAR